MTSRKRFDGTLRPPRAERIAEFEKWADTIAVPPCSVLAQDVPYEPAKSEKRSRRQWGVYPHAIWRRGRDGAEGVEETGQGYVVREVTPAVPYGRMTPVAVYKIRAAAERYADKLNEGDAK